MINLQVTTFHRDFSTLEIENGETQIMTTGTTCTISPAVFNSMIRLESKIVEEEKDSRDNNFTKKDFEKTLGKVSRRIKRST